MQINENVIFYFEIYNFQTFWKQLLIQTFRGGENIFPAEIEAALITHPDVIDAHVVGVESKRLGEEVILFRLFEK